jgi:hypothetical protein
MAFPWNFMLNPMKDISDWAGTEITMLLSICLQIVTHYTKNEKGTPSLHFPLKLFMHLIYKSIVYIFTALYLLLVYLKLN